MFVFNGAVSISINRASITPKYCHYICIIQLTHECGGLIGFDFDTRLSVGINLLNADGSVDTSRVELVSLVPGSVIATFAVIMPSGTSQSAMDTLNTKLATNPGTACYIGLHYLKRVSLARESAQNVCVKRSAASA